MNTVQINRTEQIRSLLSELNGMLKMSVEKAIEVGGLLAEQREEMQPGKFCQWLSDCFSMSEKTAYRYMTLFNRRSQIVTVTNLQEAYKQIEHIERQEKEAENNRIIRLINERKRTGNKPSGWDRACDYQWKKWADDEEYERRKREHFESKQKPRIDINDTFEKINTIFSGMAGDAIEVNEAKEKLRLNTRSDNNKQSAILSMIDEYMNNSGDVSRQIETGQNIIKYVKEKIVRLQRQTVA